MIVNVISESIFFPKGHGVHTAFLNTVEMLKQAGIDVLINSNKKADITHIHTIGPYALIKLLSTRKKIVSAHLIPESFIGSLVAAKYWQFEAREYLRFFYNRANLVLAVAPLVKTRLQEIGVSRPVEILPNPVDANLFKEDIKLKTEGRKLLGLKPEDFVVIGVGQIQPRKGIEDFAIMASKLKSIKFVWVGGKPFKQLTVGDKEMNKILKNKPGNFLMPGSFSYNEMPKIYNAANAFFFPSYQENAPMAIIEAASCSLPLVLRDIKEYKLLYKNGYLPGDTVESFTMIIKKLLVDKDYYHHAKKDSRILSSKFSFDILADRLILLYNSVLGAK